MRAYVPAIACLALSAPLAAHAQSASELYYERALMSTAGARCNLFDANIAAALAAAQAQARNTALRAGQPAAALDDTLGRAQARATAAPCQGADLKAAADKVRVAFKAYAGLPAMSFPGEVGSWRAVRAQTQINVAWRLSQSSSAGADRMILGLAGTQGHDQVTAVAAFADGVTPYAARLVLRDPARAPTPYIADLTGKAPLSARLPPPSGVHAILAQARAPAGAALLPPSPGGAAAFSFPPSAVAAMAMLDPRESVSVDFVFAGSGGDVVRRAYFEVGDFAAGVAFLRSGRR